jgi:modulator of FtsH protease
VYEHTSPYAAPTAAGVSSTQLVGRVMSLVAIAIGVLALGAVATQNMDYGQARIFSFVAIGMLFVQMFVQSLRFGALGIFWMMAFALLMGMGLGPVLNYFAEVEPDTLIQAAGGTALTVAAMGALGFALSKDLAPWMKPLSWIMFGLFTVSILFLIFGGIGSLSPFFSLIVFGISALLIMVDFNYIRKHGTENDTVWLATGIFVSIVNIFLALLNLFSD